MLKNQSLLGVIKMHGLSSPESVAVCCGDENFSYGDLNNSAKRIADYLKRHEVCEGDRVVLHTRRSFDLLASMLAVWRCGAGYVCLDSETPALRLKAIIDELDPRCILTEPAFLNRFAENLLVLTYEDVELFACIPPRNDDQIKEDDQRIAYLIYTSGSTGQPKGVLITQANLANYVFWFNQQFEITAQDVFNFNTSPAFDFAVTCIHVPLAAGAKILITPETDVLDMAVYCRQLIEHGVTFVKWAPSYFKLLINYVERYKPDLSSLRYVMIAGEELLTAYLLRWFAIYPNHAVINEYGPTETTVGITTYLITKSSLNKDIKTVPIGFPVGNSTFYVVDEQGCILPQGGIGELWIGGASVGQGYYNAPQLTQSRFIGNPFSANPATLYRTGDFVKQLPDKSYLYIGRMDKQVKINGYRVDISEIEHCLLEQGEINHACVLVSEGEERDRYLEAYVVLEVGINAFKPSELRYKLSLQLPSFMLPKYFYPIDHIPLTANGKVDDRVLREQAQQREKI